MCHVLIRSFRSLQLSSKNRYTSSKAILGTLPGDRATCTDPLVSHSLGEAATPAALTRASAGFLGRCGRFLAELTENWDQAIDLGLVQSSAERRHVPLALIDLREYFRVGELLGFGASKVFGSH